MDQEWTWTGSGYGPELDMLDNKLLLISFLAKPLIRNELKLTF